jgi:hypothetical protein
VLWSVEFLLCAGRKKNAAFCVQRGLTEFLGLHIHSHGISKNRIKYSYLRVLVISTDTCLALTGLIRVAQLSVKLVAVTRVLKVRSTEHGLRTPNEGINQRYLKNWADVADKICFGRT